MNKLIAVTRKQIFPIVLARNSNNNLHQTTFQVFRMVIKTALTIHTTANKAALADLDHINFHRIISSAELADSSKDITINNNTTHNRVIFQEVRF
jgi:hypothetical protein